MTRNTLPKGLDSIQEDLHQGQSQIEEASNHYKQTIGNCPIDDQAPLENPPQSGPSLKRKGSYASYPTRQETPIKCAKQIPETPIYSSQHIASASLCSPKFIPGNRVTADLAPTQLGLSPVQVALQTHYKSCLSIERFSGGDLDLESYVDLTIVEALDQRRKEKEKLEAQASAFRRSPSYEGITTTNTKASIPLEKLFDKRMLYNGREDVPKTILFQGRAGIGKTTLCKKLVHMHQNGLWRDLFDVVLWIPLRQLVVYKAYFLTDLLLKKFFPHGFEDEKKALVRGLEAHLRDSKVLFILDGLDEIVIETEKEGGIALKSFLIYLLRQHYVITTSRPSGLDKSILRDFTPKIDLELEIIGFSQQKIQAFLTRALKPEGVMAVQDFIRRTPLIQGLVNIPIQLDAICFIWDQPPTKNPDVPPKTMTRLYRLMVQKLWCKDAELLRKQSGGETLTPCQINKLREKQIDRLMATEIQCLAYLAFKGLDNDYRIEFNEEALLDAINDLDEYRLMPDKEPVSPLLLDMLKQTSFLHTAEAGPSSNKDNSLQSWSFLHLTLQEFFAATWISQHLQVRKTNPTITSPVMMSLEKITAHVQKHKYNPRYEIVWRMVAGLLDGDSLKEFFDIMQNEPRDILGGHHQQLLASCLEEARPRLFQLDPTMVEKLEGELMQWLQFELTLVGNSDEVSILGSHYAFPENVLVKGLGGTNIGRKQFKQIISTLGKHPNLTTPTVQELVDTLNQEDRHVRDLATKALGSQSTLSESAIRALTGTLQSDNSAVRGLAAKALATQTILPDSTIHALIRALHDKEMYVGRSAAYALVAQLAISECAVQSIIGTLQNEDCKAWHLLTAALGTQLILSESTIPVFVGALQHENKFVRDFGVEVLRTQPTLPDSTIHGLICALEDENSDVRYSAAEVLGAQPILPESAILALIDALWDKDSRITDSLVSGLGAQSMLPESAIRALIGALENGDRNVRSSAADALGSQPTLPDYAIQAIVSALQDGDMNVRSSAADALGSQSILSKSTIQALVGALGDGDTNVRSSAADALGTQPTLPDSAIHALINVLRDEDAEVRSSAADALGSQSTLSEPTIQTFICTLQDEDRFVVSTISKVLGVQSTLSESTIQSLVIALRDEEMDVRIVAAKALSTQSTLPGYAIQALMSAFQSEYALQELFSAANALSAQTTLPESAIQTLISILNSGNPFAGISAKDILSAQSVLPESAIQALVSTLQHENFSTGHKAAAVLSTRSALSESVIQVLVSALEDEGSCASYRYFAVMVLGAQPRLPESAVRAFVGTLKGEIVLKDAAANALCAQLRLPKYAIQDLIGILEHKHVYIDMVLDKHWHSIFSVLPDLPEPMIEELYRRYLFDFGCRNATALYIQADELYIYTNHGPVRKGPIEPGSLRKLITAIETVKREAGMQFASFEK
ncbi:hypothetical protein BGX21_000395 [Mortierella sp. AD011]|nr:hypothetical protein BGX20_000338 [Mortierella sp. AD010]KAF9388084.1 hypothetical protein BGX21_000395 [Mortierella sp. AD011]